jgi:hypothetical protein
MILNVLIFIAAIAVVSLLAGPIAIWFFCMRPYISEKRKNPANGASWFYSQLLDFSTIFVICRDSRERMPWFMYVWADINLLWLFLPILLFIILKK